MVSALVFEAYLNAAIAYIDKKWSSDPIIHTFPLLILNQSSQTLYFKLFNAIPNWDFGTSLPGSDEKALGSISAGSSVAFFIDMTRVVPGGETFDSGNITLKAYTDSGYLNEVASGTLYITLDIQDIESWAGTVINTFVDGGTDGWTFSGFSVSDTKSVEAGGYSAYKVDSYTHLDGTSWATKSGYLQKSINIPNKQKCSLGFFWTRWANGYLQNCQIRVLVDSEVAFIWPSTVSPQYFCGYGSGTFIDWKKIVVNLSPWKGQTKIIKIEVSFSMAAYGGNTFTVKNWIDRIIYGGKD